MKNISVISLLGALIWMMLSGCGEGDLPPNPFDNLDPPPIEDTVGVSLDPNGITALHRDVFKPTCANSGCHDGTFEPDFRSIHSTYNTLVYHPIIKNDPAGTFSVRVLPGDVTRSVLWNRLNTDIDGQSGIMPLAVEPDSDWDTQKSVYLTRIRAWIEGGAKDMLGQSPGSADLQPTLVGMIGRSPGTSSDLPREASNGAIVVPKDQSQVEFFLALQDDDTNPWELGQTTLVWSESLNDFSNAPTQLMNVISASPGQGFLGNEVDFYHQTILNLQDLPENTTLFVRVRAIDPGQSGPSELPSDGSPNYIKRYFSFIIK